MTTKLKDPDAEVPFKWDWTSWLESGDSIASHSIIVDGVTLVSSAEASGVVTATLSGGTAGETATATCRVTSANGYVDDRTITLKIMER